MNQVRLLNVLRSPHVTEKTSSATGNYRQYAFKVAPDANKKEIKAAVEQLFGVTVNNVTVCNVKGSKARFGKTIGRHKGWKKAYVALPADQEIELAGS